MRAGLFLRLRQARQEADSAKHMSCLGVESRGEITGTVYLERDGTSHPQLHESLLGPLREKELVQRAGRRTGRPTST